MASIFWMSASSSGATEAQPALLTSKVMLGSSFSFVSTFASPVSLLRSARMGVICRPLALQRPAASAFSEGISIASSKRVSGSWGSFGNLADLGLGIAVMTIVRSFSKAIWRES